MSEALTNAQEKINQLNGQIVILNNENARLIKENKKFEQKALEHYSENCDLKTENLKLKSDLAIYGHSETKLD